MKMKMRYSICGSNGFKRGRAGSRQGFVHSACSSVGRMMEATFLSERNLHSAETLGGSRLVDLVDLVEFFRPNPTDPADYKSVRWG